MIAIYLILAMFLLTALCLIIGHKLEGWGK